jgi:ribosome maturation factor RimP
VKTPKKPKPHLRGKAGGAQPEKGAASKEKEILTVAWRLAEELCQAEGLELVHLEYQREAGGRMLRAYIDKANGVTLDDCVNISRQLSEILDVHLQTDLPYHLEVSSPGADRPLGKLTDFERFRGQTARIRVKDPIAGQRNFKGTLMGITGDLIHLQISAGPIDVHFPNITKARLVNYNGEK